MTQSIARTNSSSSFVSLNQGEFAASPAAVDHFDANRTSGSARGSGSSAAPNNNKAVGGYNASPAAPYGAKQVSAAGPVQTGCQAPAPIVYHEPVTAAAQGQNFRYDVGDIQLAPISQVTTVEVPYFFGGNTHEVFPGAVQSPAGHQVVLQPVVTHERDTIIVHNSHQALDARQQLTVNQAECQIVEAQQQSPAQSPAQYQYPAKASPAYPQAGPQTLPAAQNQGQYQGQNQGEPVPPAPSTPAAPQGPFSGI